MFKGLHFSKIDIGTGSIIISNASKLEYYDEIWSEYKKSADELGLYFPYDFGFAYSETKEDLKYHSKKYLVECENAEVTRCDYRYSMQILLENSFFSPMSLNYALKNRKELKEHIENYFNCKDEEFAEYISDKFLIIEKL